MNQGDKFGDGTSVIPSPVVFPRSEYLRYHSLSGGPGQVEVMVEAARLLAQRESDLAEAYGFSPDELEA